MAKPTRWAAAPVYLALSFGQGLGQSLFWTLALFFQDKVAGLAPWQFIILGTISEVTIFLFEIPTGVVADTISRKLSVVIGFMVVGVGYAIQPMFPIFPMLALGMMGWGLGETFLSGAFEAWISDELIEEKSPISPAQIFVRGSQMSLAGSLVGIWSSVIIGQQQLGLPLFVGGIILVLLGVFGWIAMPERGFRRASEEEKSSWQHLRQTLSQGFQIARGKPLLFDALLVVFMMGLASEAFDRLWNKHITEIGLPKFAGSSEIMWFAVISSGSLIAAMAILSWIRWKKFDQSGPLVVRLVASMNGLLVVTVVGFALANQFGIAAGCYIVGRTLRRCMDPLMTAWVNDLSEPKVRATMLSIKGQVHGFGELFGGPLLAPVAQLLSVSAALLGSAACSFGAFLANVRAERKLRSGQPVPENPS